MSVNFFFYFLDWSKKIKEKLFWKCFQYDFQNDKSKVWETLLPISIKNQLLSFYLKPKNVLTVTPKDENLPQAGKKTTSVIMDYRSFFL
jgi:hypothetical protein